MRIKKKVLLKCCYGIINFMWNHPEFFPNVADELMAIYRPIKEYIEKAEGEKG